MARTNRNDPSYVVRRDVLKRQARKTGAPCHLCGRPFDWQMLDALGKEGWKHPLSFTADHEHAIAAGGKMLGVLRPSHRACNSRRGAKPLETVVVPRIPKRSRPRTA